MVFDDKVDLTVASAPLTSDCLLAPDCTTEPSPIVLKKSDKLLAKVKAKILPDITHAIGGTPLVRLNRVLKSEGVECEVLGKCEYFNPGGSIKDRTAFRMISDAEESGRIAKGDTIIEPTSGNTGIGLALVSAARGYNSVIVMPEKMSKEKADTLNALGATVIRTPGVPHHHPQSQHSVAQALIGELPRSHVLNQYRNPSNPLAHYEGTANEIIEACDGKIDMLISATGTGGTITGIGRRIKERIPKCKIIGIIPQGYSWLKPTNAFEVEGIGPDHVPDVLDAKVVDKWYNVNDIDAFKMARRLMREEGLLVGGSAGAAMAGALIAIRDANLKPDQRCVVIFPDSIRNYMTKFLSDDWLIERHFAPVPEPSAKHLAWSKSLYELNLEPQPSITESTPLLKANDDLEKVPGKCLLVYDDSKSKLVGVLTKRRLISELLRQAKVPADAKVSSSLVKNFKPIPPTESLGIAAKHLEHEDFIVIGPLLGIGQNDFALLTPETISEHLLSLSTN